MSRLPRVLLSFIAATILGGAAQDAAAYSCWFSIPTIVTSYDPANPSGTMSSGSFTLNCNRQANEPASMNYRMEMAGGTFPSGGMQRVQNNNRFYSYNFYRSPSLADPWGTGAQGIAGTLNFGASLSASTTVSYFIIVPGGQPAQPACPNNQPICYNDFVNIRLTGGATANNVVTLSISVPTGCLLTTPPGNINLTYTSFQSTPASASTTFGLRCTPNVPYTLSLDANSGTMLSLNYTLAIGPSTAGTGTGAVQNYTVTGTMAAGQIGTCANTTCSGSQSRLLTVTY